MSNAANVILLWPWLDAPEHYRDLGDQCGGEYLVMVYDGDMAALPAQWQPVFDMSAPVKLDGWGYLQRERLDNGTVCVIVSREGC